MASRDKRGRYFSAKKKKKTVVKNRHIQIDHNYDYVGKDFCDGANCKKDCNTVQHADIRKQRVETVGTGWPRSLEIRENRENGQNKFPAGKNQGISKLKKNQGIIREFYKSEEKKCVYW